MHDEFGGLSEVPFDISEWASFEISKDEYKFLTKDLVSIFSKKFISFDNI